MQHTWLHLHQEPNSIASQIQHMSSPCFSSLTAGNIAKCARVLKPSGHLSHIMNHGTDQDALNKLKEGGAGPSASLTFVKPNGAQLQEMFELIAAGKVKLEVAQVG
jgi:NADPH:quinone reductase-like Zn-dependent oxidoreductase